MQQHAVRAIWATSIWVELRTIHLFFPAIWHPRPLQER